MNIAIIPSQENLFGNNLFNLSEGRDNILQRYIDLKKSLEEKGYCVATIDKFEYADIDIIIFQKLKSAYKYLINCIKYNPKVRVICYGTEPVLIYSLNSKEIYESKMIDYVLTWNDDLIDGNKYIETRSFCHFNNMLTPLVPFRKKKYLCIINYYKSSKKSGEIYSERERSIKYFGKKMKIDLYGYGWNKHSNEVIRKVYKGSVISKMDTLKKYKFSIAYENCNNENGYISEKIFDSFVAGCIPIYYGAPNIKKLIPENTFIDFRDFANYEELEMFLDNIDEKKYKEYIDNISKFMQSDNFVKFTSVGFVNSVNNAINRITAKPVRLKNIYKIKMDFLKRILTNHQIFWNNKRFLLDLIFS